MTAGSLSNAEGDGDENGKKATGLYRKSSINPPGGLIYFKPIWGGRA